MMLQDKVAIVTGGNSGIGRAIVLALAKEGAAVAINYHSNKGMAEELQHRWRHDAEQRRSLVK